MNGQPTALAIHGSRPGVPAWTGLVAVGLAVVTGALWSGRTVPPSVLLVVAGAAILAVATVIEPRVGLVALAFAMVLSPESTGVVYVRADDVIVAVVVLGWLARQAVHRVPLRENPLLVPMIVLAATGLAALAVAVAGGLVDPFTGRQVSLTLAALHWVKRLEYFAIVFLVAQVLRTRAEVAFFTGLLLAASAVVAARGAVQVALHAGEPGFRLDAPFDTGEANTLGEYLLLALVVSLALALTVPSARLRLVLAGVIVLDGFAFLHTFSRGSYVGLLVALLLLALLKDARLLLVLAALAFVVPPYLPSDVAARIESIPHEYATLDVADVGGNALLARVDSYRVAALRVAERPVLGYGPGVVALERIESQYAKEAIDGGLLGAAAFLWLLTRTARLSRWVRAGARTAVDRGMGLGFLAVVAGFSVAALGAIPFTTIRTMEAFCFLAGLMVVLWRIQQTEAAEEAVRGEGEVAVA